LFRIWKQHLVTSIISCELPKLCRFIQVRIYDAVDYLWNRYVSMNIFSYRVVYIYCISVIYDEHTCYKFALYLASLCFNYTRDILYTRTLIWVEEAGIWGKNFWLTRILFSSKMRAIKMNINILSLKKINLTFNLIL